MLGAVLALALGLGGALVWADDLVLVSHQAPTATLVLPADASPTESFAAEELQRYVEAATGARIPVKREDEAAKPPLILVGRTAAAAALDYAGDEGFPDPYLIRAEGQRLFILGRGDRGTLYGVYDFLRRFVGCRWIMPGPRGEIVPERRDVIVPEVAIDETPAFRFRIAAGFASSGYIDWAVKSRLQLWTPNAEAWDDPEVVKRGGYVKGTMHHAFDSLLPEDEFFAGHPEYYGMLGGKRVAGTASQLCLSNPEVARLVGERAIQYFDEHPEATFFSLCPNDNQNWCECDACRAFDTQTMERWGRAYPVVSDRYFQFVNQVADALAQRHPDKLLYTFAYQNYTWPPRAHSPRDNVIVSLCHMVPACYSHPLTDPKCEQNVQFNELLSGWAEGHANMWYYAYTCKSMWEQMPWPIAQRLAADIRQLHDNGFQGFYSQGSQSLWGQLGINFHVMAPMLWDPETVVEQTLDEYFTLAFGPAKEQMTEFYRSLEAGFSAPEVHVHHEVGVWGPQVLTPEVIESCYQALQKALVAAQGQPEVLERIASVRAAFRYAWLRVEGLAGETEWGKRHSEEGLQRAVQAYREIMELAEQNPGGEALTVGSARRYVAPRLDRLALPFDALFAAEAEREFTWQQVTASSFEDDPATGWAIPGAQEDCGVEVAGETGHDGEASLRLWSAVTDEDSPRMAALTHGWIIVNALSQRIDIQPGDAVVVSACLNVPEDLQQTTRGATLGIVGYDAAGESPRGWTAGTIETRQPTQTDGWERLIVGRTVDDPGLTQIAVRLALSGLGECFFDDVEVLIGRPK